MKLPSLAIGAVPVVEFYVERGGVESRHAIGIQSVAGPSKPTDF
jgi:hypothetical protein